jgi:hypothetical protein
VLNSGRALFYQFLNLITMKIRKIKSFVFGLAFLGSMAFGGITSQAQTEPGMEGGGSGVSSVCCQKRGSFCTDRFGTPYSDSIETPGPTCTKP